MKCHKNRYLVEREMLGNSACLLVRVYLSWFSSKSDCIISAWLVVQISGDFLFLFFLFFFLVSGGEV